MADIPGNAKEDTYLPFFLFPSPIQRLQILDTTKKTMLRAPTPFQKSLRTFVAQGLPPFIFLTLAFFYCCGHCALSIVMTWVRYW